MQSYRISYRARTLGRGPEGTRAGDRAITNTTTLSVPTDLFGDEVTENIGSALNEAGGNLLRIDSNLEGELLGELGDGFLTKLKGL